MNIHSALKNSILELRKAGIPTSEIDARVLLEHALEKDSVFLHTNPSRPLTNLEYGRFRRFIRKRKNNIPVAYITGRKEFFGYDFIVTRHTLIPRPESEELVSLALHRIKNLEGRIKDSSNILNTKFNILDLGTGSGCLILSLAKELSEHCQLNAECYFFASDISSKALSVAKRNAKKLNITNVKFFRSDLFSNLRLHKKYNIILANLPYVPARYDSVSNNQSSGISHEPASAIFAEDNGTSIIKTFLTQSKNRLLKDGLILIELDYRNAEELFNFASTIYPKTQIELKKDLAGLDRYLVIKN